VTLGRAQSGVEAEVAVSARGASGGSPRRPMADLVVVPRARRVRTSARYVSVSRRVNKSGAPVKCGVMPRPQYHNLPQPEFQLVPTGENAAQQPSLMNGGEGCRAGAPYGAKAGLS
jgi:hypothetical protein